MKQSPQRVRIFLAAAIVALGVPSLRAADIYWLGGTGGFFDQNYTVDNTPPPVFPVQGADLINIGANGVVTLSVPDVNPYSFQKLRVGIGSDFDAPTPPVGTDGPGELTVSGGAKIDLTAGAPGEADGALWVGRATSGTLTIDGPGSAVTSNEMAVIGYSVGSQAGQVATLHVKNGGELNVTSGTLVLGAASAGGQRHGMQGHIILEDGAIRVLHPDRDLEIGVRRARSSVTMSGGEFTVGDAVEIGFINNSGNGNQAGSSLNISGGTFDNGGDLRVGLNGSRDATLNVSGTAQVEIGTKTTGGGEGQINRSLFIGIDETVNATANISGGFVHVWWNAFIGRGTSQGATMNLTGGELSVDQRFLLGNGAGYTGATMNHSGGTLNTGLDVRVGDAGSVGATDATYNLSGTGIINSLTGGLVGRGGTGRFIQTGGEANFGDVLAIGRRENQVSADGLYKISAGLLNAGAFVGGTALDIAPNGTGEFRVVGDDATINLHGTLQVNVNGTANGVGTLAFELEDGDLLSMINVDDSATLNAGSRLVFDVTNSLPTQTAYDVLTAQSITVDPSVVLEGAAGWSYEVVGDAGFGQTLRLFGPLIAENDADFDGDGDVDGTDFLTWQRNVETNPATQAQGDANNDNLVNGADLDVWKDQFGPAGVAASASVPEPGSLALLATALGLIGAARARRAKHSV